MSRFDDTLFDNPQDAIRAAQSISNANGSPVAVLSRHAFAHFFDYAICENPPDDEEFFPEGYGTPYDNGWHDHALLDPQDPDSPDYGI